MFMILVVLIIGMVILNNMEVKINGIYKHFKGDYYIVEDIAIDSETNKKIVIYRALYGEGILYARDYDMFLSKVDNEKYPNAMQEYRFELQSIDTKNK